MPGDYLDPVSMLHSQAALKRDRPAGRTVLNGNTSARRIRRHRLASPRLFRELDVASAIAIERKIEAEPALANQAADIHALQAAFALTH
jgi:hypothetical protein